MNRHAQLIAVGLFVVLSTVTYGAINDPIKIDSGLISGTIGTNPSVRIYRGIPYAAPPVGDRRWREPQPAAHWDGVRAADKYGSPCMPANGGSEDCLYVNVWTAAPSSSAGLPVMVWSYSEFGGSQSNGEPLAAKSVVLVTYNYRLGPFGFFSHPELTKESGRNASGNQALMDVAEVLRWVKRNIAAFGGDPNKVTIVGDSNGASMEAGMVGSPQGKGLFIRAISESVAWMGLDMSAMTPLARAEQSGVRLGTTLGAPTLAELRQKSAVDILAMSLFFGSGMIIDGFMIPEDLSLTFADGRQNPVDILVGSNKDEGIFFSRGIPASQFVNSIRQNWGDLADAYLKLYPAGTDAEARASSLATFRDTLGWHQRTYARLQEKLSTDKKLNLHVFVYYFTHDPTSGSPNSGGATHMAEANYVFNTPTSLWTDADKALGEQISSYWVNFAASGNPNGKGLPNWPEYHASSSNQPIVLGDPFDVQPDAARMSLFDARYATLKGRIGK